MAGTQNFENSVDYVLMKMREARLDNVHTENATIPHWDRGYEHCELLAPRKHQIRITGLGSSVGTPRNGIVADVIAAESFEEFDKLTIDQVRGKIVLFVPLWVGYGQASSYRTQCASIASRKGAAAVLIRSATPFSLGTLHTGAQHYKDGVRKIPVAAVSAEDASMLLRMFRRGQQITVKLDMHDRNMGDVTSRNTIAEFAGKTGQPVVVVSGHLDSWDLGVGAMDDGGGAFISWKALQLLKQIKVKQPRRTIRAILFTAEETGIFGAQEYEKQHKQNEINEFNFFMESDSGTFDPHGFVFGGSKEAECIFREIAKLMIPLNTTEVELTSTVGPDIGVWTSRGFPGAALSLWNHDYFWYHHADADSMLVMNSTWLDKNMALFAATAYVIADLSVDMPKTVTD